MIIRQDQITALASSRYLNFENRVIDRLTRHFPDDCALLGENRLRVRIREAVQAGSRYGFENEGESYGFVYLWFFLGPHFDLKPQFAGLEKLLRQPGVNAASRMDNALEAVACALETPPEGTSR
jgi:hypothetical protein